MNDDIGYQSFGNSRSSSWRQRVKLGQRYELTMSVLAAVIK
jgi:hypothetical protein